MIQYYEGFVQEQITELKMNSDDLSWRASSYSSFTIQYGTKWLKSNETMAISVPSTVLSQERNILLNPIHPHYNQLKIVTTGALNLDVRAMV